MRRTPIDVGVPVDGKGGLALIILQVHPIPQRLAGAGVNVPTLALISHLDEVLLSELLQRHCMDYLEKPVSPAELRERVRHMMKEGAGKGAAH